MKKQENVDKQHQLSQKHPTVINHYCKGFLKFISAARLHTIDSQKYIPYH